MYNLFILSTQGLIYMKKMYKFKKKKRDNLRPKDFPDVPNIVLLGVMNS